ncbi:hypothetical protein V8E55_011663 [Tylopilus felleus]
MSIPLIFALSFAFWPCSFFALFDASTSRISGYRPEEALKTFFADGLSHLRCSGLFFSVLVFSLFPLLLSRTRFAGGPGLRRGFRSEYMYVY